MSQIAEKTNQEEPAMSIRSAARLKRVRNLANLSRKEMCSDYDLNVNTYKGWEIGRYGGLSREGAVKVVDRVRKEGVLCTVEWLLFGSGLEPQLQSSLRVKDHISDPESIGKQVTEFQAIQNEIRYFSSQFDNCVDLKVSDNGMEPFYKIGEYLIGIKVENNKITRFIGENCIFGLKSGDILCRNLRKVNDVKYQLACLNINGDIEKPILYDVELVFVAPVIWHRIPQLLQVG